MAVVAVEDQPLLLCAPLEKRQANLKVGVNVIYSIQQEGVMDPPIPLWLTKTPSGIPTEKAFNIVDDAVKWQERCSLKVNEPEVHLRWRYQQNAPLA
ncbi:MAG: hypothetical protein ABR879_00510 [Methanomassiliicoccales archaeon]